MMDSLPRTLALLKSAKRPFPFIYCAADASGEPVLLVDAKRIDPRALFSLRQGAQDAALTRGMVSVGEGGQLVFHAAAPVHPKLLPHLRMVFSLRAHALRQATVVAEGGSDGV